MRPAAAAALVFPLFIAVAATAEQQPPPAGGGASEPAAAGERGRGPRDRFAGQPRVNALVISGGCCHDYPAEGRILMDAVGRALPVDWTVVVQGGRGTRGRMPVYNQPDWSRGFDIVVHNECHADVDDPEYIQRITSAHRNGPPAVVIHCAMHSYRAARVDDWREFLGVTSRRHTKQFAIPVKILAKDHPIMRGFRPDWVTPFDELYVIDKVWPNTTPLASAVSPEDKHEYPLAWVSQYGKARVFGTTLGHSDETWADPVFQDLLVRGFKWAVGRD